MTAYMIRKATEADTPAVRQLWHKAFPSESPHWEEDYFRHIYQPDNNRLFYLDNLLAGMAQWQSNDIFCRGSRQKSAFISSVAVQPSQRGRGIGHHLLRYIALEAAEQNIPLLLLIPQDAAYYQPLGFAWCYGLHQYDMPLAALAESPALTGPAIQWGEIQEGEQPFSAYNDIYQTWTTSWHGVPQRDEKCWQHFWCDVRSEGGYGYLLTQSGVPAGYLVLWQKGDTIIVREMAWCNQDACRQLFYLLWQHRSQAKNFRWYAPVDPICGLLLPQLSHGYHNRHLIQGRITNIALAFHQLPLPSQWTKDLLLQIEDPLLPKQTGRWLLYAQEGYLKAQQVHTGQPDLTLDIGALSSCWLGYRTPKQLHWQGLLQGEQEKVAQFELVFPACFNYYYQYV